MKVMISGFYDEVAFSLDEQIALLNELNEKYMCPRRIDNKNIADYTLEEFVANIKPRLDANGIAFSSIGSPIGKVDVNDEEGFQKQLIKLKELVKIAQVMNCKYIRIFSFFMPKDCDIKDYHDIVIDKLKKFLECVEGTDIVLLHENEKGIYGAEDTICLELYKELNHPQFKLCYDASNFIQVGVDPNKAFHLLKDYVVYYHMKDCDKETGVEVPLGMGDTDYKMIFDELYNRGYEGFMTLEPHTAKYALLRQVVAFVPFGKFFMPRFWKAFNKIDKALEKSIWKKVTTKEVFVIQHANLVKFIEGAGK